MFVPPSSKALIHFRTIPSLIWWWMSTALKPLFSTEKTYYSTNSAVGGIFNRWRHFKITQTAVDSIGWFRNGVCSFPTDTQRACAKRRPQCCGGVTWIRYLLYKHASYVDTSRSALITAIVPVEHIKANDCAALKGLNDNVSLCTIHIQSIRIRRGIIIVIISYRAPLSYANRVRWPKTTYVFGTIDLIQFYF